MEIALYYAPDTCALAPQVTLTEAGDRTGREGQPIPSRSRENNFVEPQPIEGNFWSL